MSDQQDPRSDTLPASTPEPRAQGDWLSALGRIPGALMLIPLFLGAIVNTFFPEVLALGSITTALFRDGIGSLLALFFFCMGSQLDLRTTGPTLEKGFAILFGKVFIGVAVGLTVAFLMPHGVLLGLTPLAIIAAMTNSNGALYAALTGQYGNHTDRGGVGIIAINDGPFITMLALGAAGLAEFPLMDLLGMVAPLVLGFVIGNLSKTARRFLEPGGNLLIPFLAFIVGRSIDFGTILQSGLQGVFLGVATLVLSGASASVCVWLFHIAHRRPPEARNIIAGISEGTTAGNAIATPAAVALVDPTFKAIESVATTQVATSTVTTALLIPFAVSAVARWQTKRGVSPATELEYYESRAKKALVRTG